MFSDEGGVGTMSSRVRRVRSSRGTFAPAALAAFMPGRGLGRPADFFTDFLAAEPSFRAVVVFGRLTDRVVLAFLAVRRAGWRFLLAFRVGRALRLAIG